MRNLALGSLLLAVAAAAMAPALSPALARQSLKSLRAQAAEEKALAAEVAYTNEVCGADMDAEIDWSSAQSWPEDASLVDSCDGALGALEAACREGADAASVSAFVCAGDASGPSLRGGTLRYGASPGVSGFSDTRDYLAGALSSRR